MIQRPDLGSPAFAPVAAAWTYIAVLLFVWIALRIADHGVAFGRWLANLAM